MKMSVLMLLAIVLAGCGSADDQLADEPSTEETAVAATPTATRTETATAEPSAPAVVESDDAVTQTELSEDEAVCTDYLGDLPGTGFLSLEDAEIPAYEADTATRLAELSSQAEESELASALSAEADMWAAGEDFSEGASVLGLCTDVLGEARTNELLGG